MARAGWQDEETDEFTVVLLLLCGKVKKDVGSLTEATAGNLFSG